VKQLGVQKIWGVKGIRSSEKFQVSRKYKTSSYAEAPVVQCTRRQGREYRTTAVLVAPPERMAHAGPQKRIGIRASPPRPPPPCELYAVPSKPEINCSARTHTWTTHPRYTRRRVCSALKPNVLRSHTQALAVFLVYYSAAHAGG